jgi:phosphoribosyl 1,2-cyclic phosphate phosphodiesterase
MILTFLGTSAANAYPEAFCGCDNCLQARYLGGKSLRKRSAALVNDDLLIDLGPDIMTAAAMHAHPLTGVRYCLQTHAHVDHLDASHIMSRSPGYGVVGAPCLHFYASRETLKVLARCLEGDLGPGSLFDPQVSARLNLEIHPIEALQSFSVGPYLVTALPANHDPRVEPLLYALQADGCNIFYGIDTAALPEETWKAFHSHKLRFDLVILDHTYGPDQVSSDHLCARDFIEHLARMRAEGLLNDGARLFATHIAHEGNPPHPQLVDFAVKYGYEVAYDGLEIAIGVA